MKFAKGHQKIGGRVKGTPNKEATTLEAQALLKGVNFWSLLCEIAADRTHPKHIDAVKEGCSYLYAKRKALEVSTEVDPELLEMAKTIGQLPKEELLKIIATEMRKLK